MNMGIGAVRHIIAVHSAKGGVGKSTLTVNLAIALSQKGFRVGVMDTDIHGPSMALMLGDSSRPPLVDDRKDAVEPIQAHGISFVSMGNLTDERVPLIWRGAMVHGMIQKFTNHVHWGELDYLLLDMPPGTGDAVLTIGQLLPISAAVVVTTPQGLSLTDTRRGLHAFKQLEIPVLGLVENMSWFVCDGCDDLRYLFGDAGGKALAKELDLPLLAQVPIEGTVCEAGDDGTPMMIAFPESHSAVAVRQAADRILAELEQSGQIAVFRFDWREMGFNERETEPPKIVPADERVLVQAVWQVSSDELGVQWHDGVRDILSVRKLRQNCPCAVCVDEITGERTLQQDRVPADIRLKQVSSVGRYALGLVFSDGHDSGIFRYDRLRELARKPSSV
ncbi:P-loop NTPase [Acanthopleuribacter pedis]|uniref:Iron-sulfur cluster carrier protein n=1 Tax=Acanthopleuribacter pedis TaxID=442870 RepID=A0A8J7U3Z5_9BACT|nr:P-loop NTPase [Acanthopleuribacter pedis]MBO1320117.1 P-loop NTPase [Acanthopleuribacter pedis]